MRMQRIRDAGVEITVARRDTHTRYVEIRSIEVLAELVEHRSEKSDRASVMDEARFQWRNDVHERLDRQTVLSRLRRERGERFLDQFSREVYEGTGARARRKNEQIPRVQ